MGAPHMAGDRMAFAALCIPIPASLVLGLGAPAVTAESAGPVWLGTHGMLTDGAVFVTAPAMDLSGAHEIVVLWERDSASAVHFMACTTQGTQYTHTNASTTALRGGVWDGSVSRAASIAGALSGRHLTHLAIEKSGSTHTPWVAVDGGAAASDGSGLPLTLTAALIRIAQNPGSLAASAAGLRLREITIYIGGALSANDRAALYASGVPGDMRTRIVRQPARYYDLSNFYDSGAGVWKVSDLITTDGTTDGTVVGGDNTDFVAV